MIQCLKWWEIKSFWVKKDLWTHFAQINRIKCFIYLVRLGMSAQYKFDNQNDEMRQQSKVKLTDLLSRINEEKKIERNRNLALSVAAVSAVTVFGIILTL